MGGLQRRTEGGEMTGDEVSKPSTLAMEEQPAPQRSTDSKADWQANLEAGAHSPYLTYSCTTLLKVSAASLALRSASCAGSSCSLAAGGAPTLSAALLSCACAACSFSSHLCEQARSAAGKQQRICCLVAIEAGRNPPAAPTWLQRNNLIASYSLCTVASRANRKSQIEAFRRSRLHP